MGIDSRKSARVVELVVVLCVAVTAALAGWRIVESKYAPRIAAANGDSGEDCREAERYCSGQCSRQLDECVETCMIEFGCVMHL
ncbi:MAG: hypothetical protein EBU49_09940 [Proteobacteria bacterium]|nr:hypothetical protein [Pseudomonadota bacterium]